MIFLLLSHQIALADRNTALAEGIAAKLDNSSAFRLPLPATEVIFHSMLPITLTW